MGALLQLSTRCEAIECYKCGITFSMPESMLARRRHDGKEFFCPNGHSQAFIESENAKLKKQLQQKEAELESSHRMRDSYRDQKDRAERQASAARGQITKIKNRIHKGVCPCCNRTFANLAKHMETQHPEWNTKTPEFLKEEK